MKTIKEIIMKRDNLTEGQANSLINEAHETFEDYMSEGDFESAEGICSEFFGLEPDYLDEFM